MPYFLPFRLIDRVGFVLLIELHHNTLPTRSGMSTFGFLAVLAILGQDTTTGISYDGTTLYDDFHYPAEELTEAAALRKTLPTLTAISGNTASLSAGGSTATVSEGDVAFGTWHVRALLVPSQMVVLEAKKQRWGQTVYLSKTGPVATLRMSVGELAGIVQVRSI